MLWQSDRMTIFAEVRWRDSFVYFGCLGISMLLLWDEQLPRCRIWMQDELAM